MKHYIGRCATCVIITLLPILRTVRFGFIQSIERWRLKDDVLNIKICEIILIIIIQQVLTFHVQPNSIAGGVAIAVDAVCRLARISSRCSGVHGLQNQTAQLAVLYDPAGQSAVSLFAPFVAVVRPPLLRLLRQSNALRVAIKRGASCTCIHMFVHINNVRNQLQLVHKGNDWRRTGDTR